ncbi:MAG: hypothetical protein WKF97_20135 [Chitinophagaceae bacterium]
MKLIWVIFVIFILQACKTKNDQGPPGTPGMVGGGCEGCELYAEGMPAALSWQTIISSTSEPGEGLVISGTIYKKDGRTPAGGVIMYLYQTDNNGYYSPAPGQTAASRHGHLRGWVKTGTDGRYLFKTIKPASYPNSTIPAHIHPTIKEPGINDYYIDDYEFNDDPFLTATERGRRPNRGWRRSSFLNAKSGRYLDGKQGHYPGSAYPELPLI